MGNLQIGKQFQHQKFKGGSRSMRGGPEDSRRRRPDQFRSEPVDLRERIEDGLGAEGTGEGRFENFNREEREELDVQNRLRRDVIDPNWLQGLNLTWVNTTTLDVSAGSWGDPDGIFEVSGVCQVIIPSGLSDVWGYIFISVSDDDRTKARAFFSLSSTGQSDKPDGFTRFRRIGVVRINSSNELEQFAQYGDYNQKSYWVRGVQVDTTVVTTPTETTLDLPDDVRHYNMMIYADRGADGILFYRIIPSLSGAATPTLATADEVARDNDSTAISHEFDIVLSRKSIWREARTGTNNLELYVNGFRDDL